MIDDDDETIGWRKGVRFGFLLGVLSSMAATATWLALDWLARGVGR